MPVDYGEADILLVEDNPTDLELTLRVFKKHQLANRIEVARDGVEALDLLFGRGAPPERGSIRIPKVILLDLKLPKIGGLEVLRRIKSDARTRTIPVVVLTSSQEEQDLVRSYQLGVNSYIVKPVNFDQFTDCLRQIGIYWLFCNAPLNIDVA
ncbi:MAG TPA: response regulator [Chthoniobacterales bacterium]|jgi:CheY-like chemotaxis protein|nr:response regulator [Chthoniobacterales bacterium]